jgi:broad specificity phosphatase PhoE
MRKSNDRATRLWILRHAVSTYNRQGRFQGSSNSSRLTEEGGNEARRAGEALAGIPFDAVYTSPLARAMETAGAVTAARALAAPVISHSALAEISLFGWEGRRYAEICDAYPDQYGDWVHRPERFSLEDELGTRRYPVREAFDRARGLAEELAARHVGKDILVVTHNGMGRALLLSALGLGPESFHTIQQNNLGVSVLEYPLGEREARLRVLNATGYIRARLPKPKSGAIGVRVVLVPEIDRRRASEWLNGAERVEACSEQCGRLIAGLPHPGAPPLTTVALAGTANELDGVLARLPLLPAPLVRAARLKPGHFTVVHYAGAHSPAALLALNLSIPGPDETGMEFTA